MNAIVDGKYIIEVMEPHILLESDEIKIIYNNRKYPDFHEYLRDKFFKKEKINYTDELQGCELFIKGTSFTTSTKSTENLKREIFEKRVQLDMEIQTYGIIIVSKKGNI